MRIFHKKKCPFAPLLLLLCLMVQLLAPAAGAVEYRGVAYIARGQRG